MTPQQMNARHLYFDGRKTQKEIAAELGVSEKTIYNWIQYFGWHKLREAAITAPCIIADNLSRQIIKFQAAIDAREEGTDIPTPEEIALQCKLINCLDKLKKYPTKGQAAQSIVTFINFITDDNSPLADTLWDKYNDFMNQKPAVHKPWHIEAGINPFFHTPPFEEKPETNQQAATAAANPAHGAPVPHDFAGRHQSPSSIYGEGRGEEKPETGNDFTNSTEYQSFTPEKSTIHPFPPPEKTGNAPETIQQSATVPNPAHGAPVPRDFAGGHQSPSSIYGEGRAEEKTPPVTEQDFHEYRHVLRAAPKGVHDYSATRFRGRLVNTKWLEYNLFQYCLPASERRFINDVKQVTQEIDYKTLRAQIAAMLSATQNMAA